MYRVGFASEADEPKQISYHVSGPGGFTTSFTADEVDVLVRMGLVRFDRTTSSNTWETRFYVKA